MISLKKFLLKNYRSLGRTTIRWVDRDIGSSRFTLDGSRISYIDRFDDRGRNDLPIIDIRDDFDMKSLVVRRTCSGITMLINTIDITQPSQD